MMLLKPEIIIDIVKVAPSWYYRILKKEHRDFYEFIVENGKGKTLPEKLFNYCYPEEYKCLHCGSPDVGFLEFTTGYRKYCSHLCQSRSENTKAGNRAFHNDKEKLAAKIEKRSTTNIEKYGVTHWMKTEEHKQESSKVRKEIWHKRFPREVNGRSRKQYSRACRHLTNQIYKEHKDYLDPNNLRSDDWVLDHIFSINDGFYNNVPLDIICHPTNLQLISKSSNSSKGYRSDKTLSDLYEDATHS